MTDEADFIRRMIPVFREELDQPSLSIDLDTRQEQVTDWDSLAHVRLVIGVERTFGVQLDVAEIESIKSVRGFYDAVVRHSR
jgi:acyl carrier protein